MLAVLGVVAHDVEVSAHDGDRGAQFVSGIVEELPLSVEGGFEPVEHPVEGVAEVGDVIVARDLDPPGEIVLADARGGLAEFADRGEHATGDQPAEEARGDERDHGDAGHRPDRRPCLLVLAGEEFDDDQLRRLGLPFDLHGHDRIGDPSGIGVELSGLRRGHLCGAGDEFAVLVEADRRIVDAALVLLAVDDAEDGLGLLGQIGLQVIGHELLHRGVGPAVGGVGLRREVAELIGLVLQLLIGLDLHSGQFGPGGREDDDEDRDREHEHDPREDPRAGGHPAALISRHRRPRRHPPHRRDRRLHRRRRHRRRRRPRHRTRRDHRRHRRLRHGAAERG